MSKMHTGVLFIVGAFTFLGLLLISLSLSGLWDDWQLMYYYGDISLMDVSVSIIGISVVLISVVWPLLEYWVDLMFTASGSEDDG